VEGEVVPRIEPQPLPFLTTMSIQEGIERDDEAGTTRPIKMVRVMIQTPQGVVFLFAKAEEARAIGEQWLDMASQAASPLTLAKQMPKLVDPRGNGGRSPQ
jgi:hypothetical protein